LLVTQLADVFQGLNLSKGQIKKKIADGQVYINEKPCKICSKPVKKNAMIGIWLPELPEAFELTEEQVIFEDGDLIVVNKPAGLATQPTLQPAQEHLYAATIAYLTRRNPGKLAYVGLHHRLDHDTSGLVVMTKRRSANKGVTDLFRDRRIKKFYVAVTDPLPWQGDSWQVKNQLGRNPRKHHRFFFASVPSGGEPAETHFRVLERLADKTVVQAAPITGRTHQIRVHLSEMGLPIWGDRVYGYGKTDRKAPRLLLHCHRLVFRHPVSGKTLEIEAPLPKEFA
jgi:RluA family pseudouridine synthase